ncbi:uroporphyrinogen decarboxylase [Methyloceanibacter caenitepidi]|uniref:Uroporphyrinogen decarboxylase n=1 Tax=Methyloceanibacter caenitepidi TaxID=1384459 RepID=A0A0A8JYB2_9HYPH|nr:uroporphyrinogen decarboxylase [Methyloceanibacter caenitepidi]BAQ15793.1 uroporphyrinogen III decarboxylase [Methyloceanibacter caenitepidi]
MSFPDSPFLSVLSGQTCSPPPMWLMRQAGRYLPEYREVRKTVPSFLDLCLTPKLAAEVTLQPLRRFPFDASIVFSDILIVPFALGQSVTFVEGEGPKLDPIRDAAALSKLDPEAAPEKLSPVYETVERVVAGLPDGVPLIGFCGAPWTVATYMVEGAGSKDQARARALSYEDPPLFRALIDTIVETSTTYLLGQVAAGCRALQIFDSWSGSLPEDAFARWCIAPTREIVERVKAQAPDIPIIGFPRGAGPSAVRYAEETGIDAVGCDTSLPVGWIRDALQTLVPVQGNLDPVLLVAGGPQLDARVHEILEALGDRPFIFNLGHGILPETPIENVDRLVRLVNGEWAG